MVNILELPQDCILLILSLTSPRAVIRSSAVSKQFLSVSKSDIVWDAFLPDDIDDIISRSSTSIPQHIVSKKDLFLHICNFPILLENDTKSFSLERRSGKICYMLGSRALTVIWHHRGYSGWYSIPNSRFPECALVKGPTLVDIKGRIDTTLLSPSTCYFIYFIYQLHDHCSGFFGNEMPLEVYVSEINDDGSPILEDDMETTKCYLATPELDKIKEEYLTESDLPFARDDGWSEVLIDMYHVAEVGDNGERKRVLLEISLTEQMMHQWKDGLIFQGIELRASGNGSCKYFDRQDEF